MILNLTVGQLIEELSKLPHDSIVQTQMQDDSNGYAISNLLQIDQDGAIVVLRSYLEEYIELSDT